MKQWAGKYYLLLFLLCALAMPFVLQNCIKPDEEPSTIYHPVYMSRTDLEQSLIVQPPQLFKSPGKIYYKPPYLFINKPEEGFYVFDNSDPANPRNIAFIKATGAHDIAAKGNMIYFDHAVDLAAAEYNPATNTLVVKSRDKNKFPEPLPPDRMSIPTEYGNATRRGDSIIIKWVK